MYDFIETEKGWIVFWGPEPKVEAKQQGLENVKRVAFVQEERQAAPLAFYLSLTK
jgi:hypothetical protein